jgi:hypothetical protein
MTTQDTGKFRTNTADQFYTNVEVAKQCIRRILAAVPEIRDYRWIEPSAGSGAFLHHVPSTVPQKVGLDIDPKAADILKQDYLTWTVPDFAGGTIVVGNPPFGRQSTLAKQFIKKSCTFANTIAFILPRSFMKPSMNGAFASHFHCLESVELGSDAFVLNGTPYDVPCVFQIWIKRATPRPAVERVEPVGFHYVKGGEPFHIAIRRVGVNAGQCYKRDGTAYSVQSHYFIVLDDPVVVDALVTAVNAHEFPSNTVGPRSLSKPEINAVVNTMLADI